MQKSTVWLIVKLARAKIAGCEQAREHFFLEYVIKWSGRLRKGLQISPSYLWVRSLARIPLLFLLLQCMFSFNTVFFKANIFYYIESYLEVSTFWLVSFNLIFGIPKIKQSPLSFPSILNSGYCIVFGSLTKL
ncbi:hypothetical protein DM860_013801 [Cuscuta australis]|uniref:Uncharacterized protein n=1 Tax=Cuscuta australis TaxID=267555 RepID=A0A328DHY6_9ASTE|nr:hypothetical protein DM860_013801 [Cuscuta australis]